MNVEKGVYQQPVPGGKPNRPLALLPGLGHYLPTI